MKCPKCGAELRNKAKYCSSCGCKVESNKSTVNFHVGNSEESSDNSIFNAVPKQPKTQSKIKNAFLKFWKLLDMFCKITAIFAVIIILLLLVSLMEGKTAAVVISVCQLLGIAAVLLIHKDIIKIDAKKSKIKYLTFAAVVLLTVVNIWSFSWGQYAGLDYEKSDIPEKETAVYAPYHLADCIGKNYIDIEQEFRDAGFTDINCAALEDLTIHESERVNSIENITVNGEKDDTIEQEYHSTDPVMIRYHAYRKCTAVLKVDFLSNLIFDKYNVNLLMAGENKGTLEHGEDTEFQFIIDPGEYIFIFESTENPSVKGEFPLTIDCDLEASYQISCSDSEISVEMLYVDKEMEIPEGKIKLNVSESEYAGKNYLEVESLLKKRDFSNIKYNILYDIYLGWTETGSVSSVSIDGKSDFRRGDIFDSNAEIIITYHMEKEDEVSQNQNSEPEMDDQNKLTVHNCPELAEMVDDKGEGEGEEIYSAFARKYADRIIVFDGSIDYCVNHENYDTRFDYLLSAGDYDPDYQIGPTFKFENVAYYDLNTDLDVVGIGINVHIVAKVKSFNDNTGIFLLEPVSVTGR